MDHHTTVQQMQTRLLEMLFWEPPDALSEVARMAADAVHAQAVTIHLLTTPDSTDLICEACAPASAGASTRRGATAAIGVSTERSGIIGQAAAHFSNALNAQLGEPKGKARPQPSKRWSRDELWGLTDVLTDEEHQRLLHGQFRSFLAVPLASRKGRLLGLVACWNKEDSETGPIAEFADTDAKLMGSLAPALAAVTGHKHMRDTIRLILQDMQEKRGVVPLGEERPNALLRSIIEKSCVLLGAFRGDFAWWSVAEDGLVYAALHGEKKPDTEDYRGTRLAVNERVPSDSCIARVFTQASPDFRVIEDVKLLDAKAPDYAMAHPDTRSELAVRVDLHRQPVGVLNVESDTPSWFDETDVAILRVISRHAAIAVQMVRFEELVRMTMEHQGDPEDFLQPVLNDILETLGFDEGLIYRWDATLQRLVIAACKKSKDVTTDPTSYSYGKGEKALAVWSFDNREFTLSTEDPTLDSRVSIEGLDTFQIKKRMACCPLVFPDTEGNDQTVGVLVMWPRQRDFPRDFHEDLPGARARLEPYARLAAAKVALWNAQQNAQASEERFKQLISHDDFPLRVFLKQRTLWSSEEKKNLPSPEVAPDGPKFVFTYANPRFREDVGMAHDASIEGKTDWDFYPPKDALGYYKGDLKVGPDDEVFHMPNETNQPLGRKEPMKVEVWKLPLVDPTTGQVGQIEGVFWDRTEELDMKDQLHMQLTEKDRLFTDLRHRFHNDLRTLNAFLDDALMVLDEPDIRSSAVRGKWWTFLRAIARGNGAENNWVRELIKDTSIRLQHIGLVHQYLYDARPDQDPSGMVEARDLLEPLLRALAGLFQPRGDQFQTSLDFEIADVQLPAASAVACGLIFTECISNSIKHSRKQELPSVSVKAVLQTVNDDPEALELLVSDDGPGLQPDFDPENPPTKSLGLRLMLSRARDFLGSKLEVRDSLLPCNPPCKGVTFAVRFARTAVRHAENPKPYTARDLRSRVLLVEDNPDEARTLTKRIEAEKFDVRWADSKKSAIEFARELRPSVIVMDIALGLQSSDRWAGIEAAAELSDTKDRPPPEILLMTSLAPDNRELQKRIADLPHKPHLISKRGPYMEGLLANIRIASLRQLKGWHIFICYSHLDKDIKEEMDRFLAGIDDSVGIKVVWSDKDLQAGDDWKHQILNALEHCAVAICLVSQSFMNSRFIRDEELPRIKQKCDSLGTRVFPIQIRPTGLDNDVGSWLKGIHFYGETDSKSLDELWPDESEGLRKAHRERFWVNLANEIGDIVKRARSLFTHTKDPT